MGLTRPRAYQIFDIDYKQSVRVVTVSNVTLGGGAPSQVDGVSLSLNDRVLVTGQSTASQNGLYYVTTVGTGSNGTWQRSVDGNETGEIDAGMIVMVTEGTTYADTQWKLTTNDPIVIGSTALTFVQNYSANSVSAGTSNVVVTSNANVSIATGGSNVAVFTVGGPHQFTGNLNPTANVTYSLGNATNRWKDIYLANNSIYLGNITLSADANQLLVNSANVVTATANGAITTTGNVTGSYFIGNGSQLTGVISTATAITNGTTNITAGASANANVTVAGTANVVVFSTSGVNVAGYVTATGNITGNYILGNGALLTGVITSVANINNGTSNVTVVSANGNITVGVGGTGNVAIFSTAGQNVTGYLTASGNITGGNVSAGTGTISVGGLTLNGNTITSSGSTLTIDPNGSGGVDGQVTIAGNLQVTGNVTYINSNVITVNDLLINVANNAATAAAANGGGLGVGPVDAEYAKLTYNSTSNTWVISNGANVSGVVTATGNITGSYFIGNGYTITSVNASNVSGTVANATYATSAGLATTATSATTAGTVTTAAQPNITSVGTLSSLSVTGNVTGGNILTAGQLISSIATGTAPMVITSTTKVINLNVEQVDGYHADTANTVSTIAVRDASANIVANYHTGVGVNVTGNITGGNLAVGTGNITGGNVTGFANINATTHTGTTVSVTGNITGLNFIGNGSTLTNLTAANVTGTVANATYATSAGSATTATSATTAGTVTTAAQPNITSVGTLSSLSVTANITGGNLAVGTGNITGGNVTGFANVNATTHTGTTVNVTGNITGGNIVTAGVVSATGNISGNYFIGNGSQLTGISASGGIKWTTVANTAPSTPNVGDFWFNSYTGVKYQYTNDGTGNVWVDQSFPTTFSTIGVGAITNTNANGVGNIGSSTGYFNTVFAKATSAQYADLAEMYVADGYYPPGHVVVFGGEHEITLSTQSHDTAVAGIVSTNPSYLMNSTQEGEWVLAVALTGRVPCLVQGPVKKGDVLVTSSNPGMAQRIGVNYQPGCVIGKSLEAIDDNSVQLIEVAVGRF